MSPLAPGTSGSVAQLTARLREETIQQLHAVRHVPVLRSPTHAISRELHVQLKTDWRDVDDTVE